MSQARPFVVRLSDAGARDRNIDNNGNGPTIRKSDASRLKGAAGRRDKNVKDSVAAPGAPVAPLDTVPKLLLRNAVAHADRPAIRHKDYGIWQTWTWAQLRDEVRAFAVGLRKLGLERGETVAIIGDNRPRLYATFAAVQSLGGIPVPVYQDSVADEMAYVLEHAEVKFAVVEDQEQVDKVLSVAERLPRLRKIVYDDPSGLKGYDPANLHSFEHVQELGREEMRDQRRRRGLVAR